MKKKQNKKKNPYKRLSKSKEGIYLTNKIFKVLEERIKKETNYNTIEWLKGAIYDLHSVIEIFERSNLVMGTIDTTGTVEKNPKKKDDTKTINALEKLFFEYHEGKFESMDHNIEIGDFFMPVGRVTRIEYVSLSEPDIIYYHDFQRENYLFANQKNALITAIKFTERGFES